MNNRPYVSPDFTMEDIRRIRTYNAERYEKMTHIEIIADMNANASKILKMLEERKNKN